MYSSLNPSKQTGEDAWGPQRENDDPVVQFFMLFDPPQMFPGARKHLHPPTTVYQLGEETQQSRAEWGRRAGEHSEGLSQTGSAPSL